MFKKLITMMTSSYHAHNPFMRTKVNKYNIFANIYNYYREERIAHKRIQNYADYITKQCKREMETYGHIHDGNLASTFVGVIYHDWLSRINAKMKEPDIQQKVEDQIKMEKSWKERGI